MTTRYNADHAQVSAPSQALRNIPLFCDLGEPELAEIAQLITIRTYPRRSTIIEQDQPGNALYLVLSGAVSVSTRRPDGRDNTLAILAENDFFGEMSLFDESPRTATITALTPVTAGVIKRDDFLSLLDASPDIRRSLVIELSKRLRATDDRVTLGIHHEVHERLASLLLTLSQNFGNNVPNGIKM